MESENASSTRAAQGSAASDPSHDDAPAAGQSATDTMQKNAQDSHASTAYHSQISRRPRNGVSGPDTQQERNSDQQIDDIALAHIGAQFTQ
ncbi:hypothetical protein E4U21_004620 [Claviceps maximensis]|nr:hypothetical protein E4U21_004620 [Claviceps maximensis]